MRARHAADHAIEAGPDLVRAVGGEGVAGRALLGDLLALGGIGGGDEAEHRLERRGLGCGCRAAAFGTALMGGLRGVMRLIDEVGEDPDAQSDHAAHQDGGGDLVAFQ